MNRWTRVFLLIMTAVMMPLAAAAGDVPKGAKAIFETAEGDRAQASNGLAAKSMPAGEKYAGIAYRLVLLKSDGAISVMPRTRTFRPGERIKLLVRTNQSGYLTVMNIAQDGNAAVLFDEFVEARRLCEIPRPAMALKFAGDPGTETLIVMLSDSPNPIVGRKAENAIQRQGSAPADPQASHAAVPSPAPGAMSSVAAGTPELPRVAAEKAMSSLPPPTPLRLAQSMQESKDLLVKDRNQTGYALISPRTGWRPSVKESQDILLEYDARDGSHYGVVPASALSGGGILALDLKLTHR